MGRADALDWAARARAVRFALREQLAAGEVSLDDVLGRAGTDELVGAARLGWVLESLPGARKDDTRRRLAELGIDPAVPIDSLRAEQVAVVRDRFGTPAGGIASSVPPLPHGSSVIVIAGPGGGGKGTLVELLVERDPRLWLSRSWTTRDRRPGESADAYHFASTEEFLERARAGGFLEWTSFLDYFQGSPIPEPDEGADVLFEIDVRGAENVKRLYPDALLIFVDAPDRAVQEARLRGRGDDESRIRQRLEKAEEEVERAAALDFVHVVNDDLARAVEELAALIEAHRSR